MLDLDVDQRPGNTTSAGTWPGGGQGSVEDLWSLTSPIKRTEKVRRTCFWSGRSILPQKFMGKWPSRRFACAPLPPNWHCCHCWYDMVGGALGYLPSSRQIRKKWPLKPWILVYVRAWELFYSPLTLLLLLYGPDWKLCLRMVSMDPFYTFLCPNMSPITPKIDRPEELTLVNIC